MNLTKIVSSSVVALLLLSGCETSSTTKYPLKGNINGIVLEPVASDENYEVEQECLTLPIPGGYKPVSGVDVSYISADLEQSGSLVTDSCGRFYDKRNISGLKFIQISKNGYHTMRSNVSLFENPNQRWGVVSTATDDNSFAVRVNSDGVSLSYNSSEKKFKYTVIDTKIGRAVLGIPDSQVALYKDKDLVSYNSYKFNNLNADLVLTLDASGSMQAVYQETNSSKANTGFDLVYAASKSFIDELSGDSEIGFTIFDSNVKFVDRGFVNSLGLKSSITDKKVSLQYPNDGFLRDKKMAKFIIDIYHPNSKLYNPSSTLVSEYPFVLDSNSTYSWGGATAYFDASVKSIEQVASSMADKRIVVLMTDGSDNSSSNTVQDVIRKAIDNQTTIYTISMGGFHDQSLADIAQATGGVYIQATGTDIGDKFKDLLSEIQYFYEFRTDVDKNRTTKYRVDVDLNGEILSGYLELNTTVEQNGSIDPGGVPVNKEAMRLFEKCMACHGTKAEKPAYNVSKVISTMEAQDITSVLSQYKSRSIDQYGYGDIMYDQIKTYSDDQISTVADYVVTFKPETNTSVEPDDQNLTEDQNSTGDQNLTEDQNQTTN